MATPVQKLPTARQFAALDRSAQREVLRRAPSRQKARLLLEVADGEELVGQLPPQELFLLARELGPDQVPELLALASAEQWTAFLDFDCWDGDRFDPPAVRTWLAVLLEGEEAGIVERLLGLDFELLVLILHGEVVVLSGPETIADEAERGEVLRRDGGYVLDYRDEEGAKLFGALLDLLWRYTPEFFRYLLEAVRAEGRMLLEESVYQQRAGRLLDLGIPDAPAARTVYAWLDPESCGTGARAKVALGGSERQAPVALLQLAHPAGALGAALAEGIAPGTAWELTCLINKVLVADRVDPGELPAVREVVARCYATVERALEYLAGSDVQGARHCLATTYVEELFRLGHSLTLRLQRRAQAVHDAAIGPYLEEADRLLVAALRQRRPQFPESLAAPGRGGMKAFTALHEVRLVEARLDHLGIVRRLFEERFPFALPAPDDWPLAGCHPESAGDLTLPVIFLTALANRVLGREFAPHPLPAAELVELHGLVSRAGELVAGLREQTVAWLESLEAGSGSFGERGLDLLAEEFCAVAPQDLDPRYLGGLIVRG